MIVQNIKKLCEDNGITVRQLEKQTGIGNGVIGKWKKSSPTIEKISKVADFFGVTIDTLIK